MKFSSHKMKLCWIGTGLAQRPATREEGSITLHADVQGEVGLESGSTVRLQPSRASQNCSER